MRCLTLATCLRESGHTCYFICQELPGNLVDFIFAQGFQCFTLKNPFSKSRLLTSHATLKEFQEVDAEITVKIISKEARYPAFLVVDNYLFDRCWETICQHKVKSILVIDDLANRPHNCDLLLDQNYYIDAESRYRGLTHERCQHLIGPRFMLLRDEFLTKAERSKKKEGIFVSFGGTDSHDMTFLIVKDLLKSLPKIRIRAVIGAHYSGKVRDLCRDNYNLEVYQSVSSIAEIMRLCELSIGAGGVTIFEKQFLGLPSIAYSISDNQRQALEDLDKGSFIKYLGHYDSFDGDRLTSVTRKILRGEIEMKELDIQDGKKKVASRLIS